MRLLITGGTGFIGRYVAAEARRRQHLVRILSRQVVPAGQARDVELITHDLREPHGLEQALQGINCVIHCAALLDGTEADMEAVTVNGTRHLMAAMARAGVGHIVGVSTLAVYDYQAMPVGSVLDERAPLETHFDRRHPYVRAKRAQESIVLDAMQAQGGRAAILRPGLVYGPGRTWFHELGVRMGRRLWLSLAGASPLPLVFVEHLADAVLCAAELTMPDSIALNIVDNDLPERRTYASELATRTTPHPVVLAVPWGLLDGSARVASRVDAALFRARLPLPDLLRPASLHERSKPLRYSNGQAKARLAWQPRLSRHDALDRCFDPDRR